EGGEDSDAVDAGHLVATPDVAHLAVEQCGSAQQSVTLVRFAGDQVIAVEDADVDGFAHAFCSRDRSRRIMASTRALACSFLVSSAARSPMSCSWLVRRLRFSSARRRTRSARRSILSPSPANCSCGSGVVVMESDYQASGSGTETAAL